ncbi:MAG: membrane-bound lytic murein transglycosylase MltF [Gammaproteobacteria bacterium]|nr:membrane-bound lytic murein transglycosylase MltF [Gammaproteobacteria bacterium]
MSSPTNSHTQISVALTLVLVLTAFVVAAVFLRDTSTPLLEKVKQRGELVVATRRSTTAVYDGANGPDGFEYTLAHLFANELGVELRLVYPQTVEQLFSDIDRRKVDMVSAGLTVTSQRQQYLAFSTPYLTVSEQVVYRVGQLRPRSLADIADGDLHVVASSSHEETLRRRRDSEYPELSWRSRRGNSTRELLSQVDRGEIRLTVADSNAVAMERRFYRHIATAFDISDSQPIAWAFRKSGDSSLRDAANRFLAKAERDGTLQRLRARFFGHTGRLNFVDTREFWRNVRDRLPQLRPWFEQAAAETGYDWSLLAAIGYQESHWRADAVSPTGVRGIMMLTRAAAKRVGVRNRSDPEQSILGGARYLKIVERKIPRRIQGPSRLWLTLAGYNVGFGHLEDARILTERDGANADLWLEVKQRLPLLADKAYYQTVKRGFARGQEPVDYVDNIRNYYDMLVWFTTTRDGPAIERLLADDG